MLIWYSSSLYFILLVGQMVKPKPHHVHIIKKPLSASVSNCTFSFLPSAPLFEECLSICVLMFEYLCLCVHSPFYPLNLCLSSSSVSIEGLIPLMRGLRGLLVVQTFNAHLFARFSFRTHLFGFPFSLAVGHQAPRLYYLPIYSVTVQCISLLFMLYLCSAAKE